MTYMILGEEGKEYGPIDPETLKKWVEHGRVFKDTKVRNSLMKRYSLAGDLDFLAEAFEGQEELQQQETGFAGKLLKAFLPPKKEKDELEAEHNEVSTSFKNRYVPNPATLSRRVNSFLVDAVILTLFAIVLFVIMNLIAGTFAFGEFSFDTKSEIAAGLSAGGDVDADAADAEAAEEAAAAKKTKNEEEKAVEDESKSTDEEQARIAEPPPPPPRFVPSKTQIERLNRLFLTFFAVFSAVVLLYYGIAMGLYAQTCGMRYWGIFIVKGHDGEAFPLRAYAFVLASILLWPLMPLFVLLNPSKRSLHGYLTGCRLISITAKPK
ncbi:MAG: RDD family protein [Kiritimatiellaeota bacterium]|nr:RDD family protein [Kiritimatiellota bacterium]